jgi:hypothetical protein
MTLLKSYIIPTNIGIVSFNALPSSDNFRFEEKEPGKISDNEVMISRKIIFSQGK